MITEEQKKQIKALIKATYPNGYCPQNNIVDVFINYIDMLIAEAYKDGVRFSEDLDAIDEEMENEAECFCGACCSGDADMCIKEDHNKIDDESSKEFDLVYDEGYNDGYDDGFLRGFIKGTEDEEK